MLREHPAIGHITLKGGECSGQLSGFRRNQFQWIDDSNLHIYQYEENHGVETSGRWRWTPGSPVVLSAASPPLSQSSTCLDQGH